MTDEVKKNVPSDFPLLDQDILTDHIEAMREITASMVHDCVNGKVSKEQTVENFLKVFLHAMNSGVSKGIDEGRRQVMEEVINKIGGSFEL